MDGFRAATVNPGQRNRLVMGKPSEAQVFTVKVGHPNGASGWYMFVLYGIKLKDKDRVAHVYGAVWSLS